MGRYEVDSERVQQAGAAVRGSVTILSGQVNAMMRHLEDLQNSWKGQAATTFQHVVTDWRVTQGRVHDCLDDIQRSLETAARQYAETEHAVNGMFHR